MEGPDTLAFLQQLLAGQPLYRPEDRGNYLQRQHWRNRQRVTVADFRQARSICPGRIRAGPITGR